MQPVVMIGLDGVEWTSAEALMADGELPHLRSVVERGRVGRFALPDGTSDTASWASFATARFPEHHGWINVFRPEGYRIVRVHRDALRGRPFWEALSDAGATVTVLDAPKAPVATRLDGVQLTDWLAHSPDEEDAVLSCPPEFAADVVARHGRGHRLRCELDGTSDAAVRAYVDQCRDRTTRVGALVQEQLAARDADLVVVAFGAAHCAGHCCWHLHDPANLRYDPAVASRLGDPVADLYRQLDDEVGRMLEAIGPQATVILFSPRGMTSMHVDPEFTEEVLRRLDAAGGVRRGLRPRLVRAWRRAVPLRMRTAMPARWHRAAKRSEEQSRAKRSWFGVDVGVRSGGIRLNLAGREEDGIVPADRYEATLERVGDAFRALRDADTGEPIVAAVERPAEGWRGPPGLYPDLLVHWIDRPMRAARSDDVGEVVVPRPRRSGHHNATGWFVAAGPGIDAGPVLADRDICDLPVTVAHWFSVDLPDADGSVIPELVSPVPSAR